MHTPGLELRVVFRSKIGTTIAWCSAILTPEQKGTRQFFYRLGTSGPWTPAKVVMPPSIPPLAQALADGRTEAIMVAHVMGGPLKDDTTYEVLAVFGESPNTVQGQLTVMPVGQRGDYAARRRVEMGGQVVRAEAVYITGISPEAASTLAKAIKQEGLEVETPDPPKPVS